MLAIESNNINEIQLMLLNRLKHDGKEVVVRNHKTIEIYPVLLKLTNINNRCTTLSERKWNIIFAFGEFCWHLKGDNTLNFIKYYSKNWESISVDKGYIYQSCYGAKIFRHSETWNRLLSELKSDSATRRAVINLYDSDLTLGIDLPDVSCTLSLQFLIRNNQLDLIVNMRSNDIIWGLPNDIFFFTMFQELVTLHLEIDTGSYYHYIGSLHIYKRHYQIMDSILNNPSFFLFTMPEMKQVEFINQFLLEEEKIRNGLKNRNINSIYWDEILNILRLRSKKTLGNEKEKIIKESYYTRLIKLCPTKYIHFNN